MSILHRLLLLAWLLTLGTSLIIDLNVIDDHPPLKLSLRMASSFILVLAACVTITRVSQHLRPIAILVALGMFLGFLGDLAMAGLIGKGLFPSEAIGGMLFFGLGHLAYITASQVTRRKLQLPANARWWLAIVVWQVIGFLNWYFVVARSEQHPALHYPALGYGSLLAATAGITSALALLNRRFIWVALGAALFLFSDAVIAVEMFQGSTPLLRFLVWATYGPGQMLIVYGFAYALRKNSQPATSM
ncbi:MAG TPA: lysoplasmalogenase [Gemmatales bacterium]|nr:lysoplasmalogenase [Gemmatales bacterium]